MAPKQRKQQKQWKQRHQLREDVALTGTGRSPTAFTTSSLLLLLAVIAGTAEVAHAEPDVGTLLESRSYFDTPRFEGVLEPTDHLPNWYNTWKVVLHNQIDGLFSAVEQRASALQQGAATGSPAPPHFELDDGMGFKIEVVGDSTIRMQANMLAWLLKQRTAADGRKQCYDYSFRDDANLVELRCTAGDRGVEENGIQPEDNKFVVSLHYTKVFNECRSQGVDADFVYFGCGLHFLQLVPERRLKDLHLDSWVHYERLLEEAVLFFRSGGGAAGNRVPIGEAFMTTHSFAVERLELDYDVRVTQYAEGNETVLAACRETANALELIHLDWPNEYEPEEICAKGCFDDRGVVNLNRRAEKVMDKLDVPMVRSYDITQGQTWATPPQDGRHYPALVPMEMSSFLSEITMALRRERRANTSI